MPDKKSVKPSVRSSAPFKRWAQSSIFVVGAIGLLGVIGWLLNFPILAQGSGKSVLISPRAALLFSLIAVAFWNYLRNPTYFLNPITLGGIGVLSIVLSLSNNVTIPYFDGILEPILLRNLNIWEYIYRDRMSPADVYTFFAIGIVLISLICNSTNRRIYGDIAGAISFLLVLAHGVILLGYSYGIPLQYPSGFKPSSLPSSLAFIAMGISVITSLGSLHFPLRWFSGSSVEPRLFRTFLPVGIASVLIYSVILHTVFSSLNPAISTSLSAFIATLVVFLLIARSSTVVSVQIERAVRESEKRFEILVGTLKDYAVFLLDPSGHVMTWNNGAERFKGYRAEEIIGKDFSVFYTPSDRAKDKPLYILSQTLAHGSYEDEGWRLRKDGTAFWADVVLTAIYDDDGQLRGFSKVVRDMSERKKSEEALRQKTALIQMLQRVSAAANEASTLSEAMQMGLQKVCGHTEWSLGHGLILTPTGEALTSVQWWGEFSNEKYQKFKEKSESILFTKGLSLPGRVLSTGSPAWITDVTIDNNFLCANEAKAAGIKSGCAFPILSGTQIVGVLEFFSENKIEPDEVLLDVMIQVGIQLGRVSEREKSQLQMSAALNEKEVLLKEIHHRVKNNLQIISSLLRLQSTHVSDPSTLAMFRESQNRVKSMALIHEYLYQSTDLSHVHFSNYVTNLVKGLISSYGVDSNVVEIEIRIESVPLQLDTAIPCGLIITELLSNVFKYAFPNLEEKKSRKVLISFHSEQKPHTYKLCVTDNGIGIPVAVNVEQASSLGLRLVHTLVQQLGGTLHINRDEGTEFCIVFTVSTKEDVL